MEEARLALAYGNIVLLEGNFVKRYIHILLKFRRDSMTEPGFKYTFRIASVSIFDYSTTSTNLTCVLCHMN